MTIQTKRTFVTFAFVGLLIGPAIYMRMASSDHSHNQAVVSQDHAQLLARYGFVLRQSASDAGIDFDHHPPRLDSRLDHIAPQVAAMGASVAVVDFDRDGWQDFYVTDSAPDSLNRLYRNKHDGTFVDVAGRVGLADLNRAGTGACMGSIWADIDNDGYEDVLVYKWGTVELFRNQSGESFERVTKSSGLPAWNNVGCATWLDYDCDGLIDLLLAGYWPDDVHLENLEHTRIMPESFEYAKNGGRKWLLRNKGNGRFEDVTQAVGIDSKRWTLAVVAADFNDDTYPDLFLANDYGVSELYVNEGASAFTKRARRAALVMRPKAA